MKEINEPGLFCPVCGDTKKVILRRNASKEFQVHCRNCGSHTGWYTKTAAIIEWFKLGIQYWKNTGRLNLDTPDTRR